MDIVHDLLLEGRPLWELTVVDRWSRQTPVLEAGSSFSGRDVVRVLERTTAGGGAPDSITVDHGTGFMSKAGAFSLGVQLDFTRPGTPTDNSYIESFGGRLRRECPNPTLFTTLKQAQFELEAWRTDYNNVRPHGSLGHVPPADFRAMTALGTDRKELLVSRA